MSIYLEKQIRWFEGIDEDIKCSTNERHAQILRTYKAHAAYELVGQPEMLLGTELMTDDPCYVIFGFDSDEVEVHSGKAAIKSRFYDVINEGVVLVYDEDRRVYDWGLTMKSTVSVIVDRYLLPDAQAYEEGTYIIERLCVERWPFDDRGRVAGEEVYQVGPDKITKLSADEVVSEAERNAAIQKFLPAVETAGVQSAVLDQGGPYVQAR